MWQDPIVKEIRGAGEKLAKKANYKKQIIICIHFFKIYEIMKKRPNQK
ncbi:hypothetical protein HZA55_00815 [Candidatus Poribacteria bacterium]|nr:hypothetical protein [Candidatus Poribacteria bacterium]